MKKSEKSYPSMLRTSQEVIDYYNSPEMYSFFGYEEDTENNTLERSDRMKGIHYTADRVNNFVNHNCRK